MSAFKRWVIIVLAYVAIFPIVATPCYLAMFFLAGPHGGVLPDSFRPIVLILAWLILIVAPFYLTFLIARRLPKI